MKVQLPQNHISAEDDMLNEFVSAAPITKDFRLFYGDDWHVLRFFLADCYFWTEPG